jgi:ubiquinone/menaquinone biosynthesis C-methylase UbiE
MRAHSGKNTLLRPRYVRDSSCPLVRLWIWAVLISAFGWGISFATEPPKDGPYEFRVNHDPDGIGKFYMGREIAHVMGHEGADWLERPERVQEENPEKLIDLLALQPGQVVADIGAGTGYISSRLAKKVSPGGKVYAVDIQQEMLDLLSAKMKASGIQNVVPILGAVADPKLPTGSVDLVVMVDVYHEFSEPHEMMQNIARALKPGGRVAFVEYRAEDPTVPIKRVHKMSEAQVKKEAAAGGLQWEKTIEDLPRQHLILVQKPKK